MAEKNFLVPINLNQLELKNGVLQNAATSQLPNPAVAGQVCYNTSLGKFVIYNGSNWITWTDYSEATTSAAGLMSAADKTKLNGIATGAEVNQNAFSNVKVGSSTVAADSKTDTLELAAGTNVTLTPDTTNDKVTIATSAEVNQNAFSNMKAGSVTVSAAAKTDTFEFVAGNHIGLLADTYDKTLTISADWPTVPTYTQGDYQDLSDGIETGGYLWAAKDLHDYVSASIGSVDAMRFKGTIGTGGTVTSLPSSHKRGDTYRVITAGQYAGQQCEIGDLIIALGTSGTTANDWTVAQTNIDGAITSISKSDPITVSGSGSSRTIGISAASGSSAGSMSAAHYTKLEGIATGAEVNQNAFSNVAVSGQTTVAAASKTATLTLAAGSNVTLTTDNTNKKVTIASTDNDTKNTAGTTEKTATKLYLAGATSQGANPQTYSNSYVYIGTDNELRSGGYKVLTTNSVLDTVKTVKNTIATGSTSKTIALSEMGDTLDVADRYSRVISVNAYTLTTSGSTYTYTAVEVDWKLVETIGIGGTVNVVVSVAKAATAPIYIVVQYYAGD